MVDLDGFCLKFSSLNIITAFLPNHLAWST